MATRIDGATDVVLEDHVNGRLVERDDDAGLAAALTDVLSNAEPARALGNEARRTIETRYDIGQTAAHWLEAYETVLR